MSNGVWRICVDKKSRTQSTKDIGNISPVVLKVVDDIADGRVGAVLEQSHLGALPRSGKVALQSRCARIEHAIIAVVVVVAPYIHIDEGGVGSNGAPISTRQETNANKVRCIVEDPQR